MPGADRFTPVKLIARRALAQIKLYFVASTLRTVILIVLSGSLVLICLGHLPGEALASYVDQQNLASNSFATTALGAPRNLTADLRGHDVQLNWEAGQASTRYEVLGAASERGNCAGASFDALDTTKDLNYLDRDRYTPSGLWFCYQVVAMRDAWSSLQDNPVAAVQIGFVASSVQLINNGDSAACGGEQYGEIDELDCGDQIIVSFNQAVDPSSGPGEENVICADHVNNVIWLGNSEECEGGAAERLGSLSGSVGSVDGRFSASYTWEASDTVLIVTVGSLLSGDQYPGLPGASYTYLPAANLLSAQGEFSVCDSNANGSNCLPDASWAQGSPGRQARVVDSAETPTPIDPTPAPSPTPDDAITTITPPPIAEPTLIPTDQPTALPIDQPLPTDTPESTVATPMDTATSIALPSPTPTLTPTPTATINIPPAATDTPEPTATELPAGSQPTPDNG